MYGVWTTTSAPSYSWDLSIAFHRNPFNLVTTTFKPWEFGSIQTSKFINAMANQWMDQNQTIITVIVIIIISSLFYNFCFFFLTSLTTLSYTTSTIPPFSTIFLFFPLQKLTQTSLPVVPVVNEIDIARIATAMVAAIVRLRLSRPPSASDGGVAPLPVEHRHRRHRHLYRNRHESRRGSRSGEGRRRRQRLRRRSCGGVLRRRWRWSLSRPDRRQKRPNFRRWRSETIVLFDQISEIFVGFDRNQSFEIFVGQLTPQTHRWTTHLRRLQQQLRKGDGARDGENTSMAAMVAELSVGIARSNLAAIAAEEFDGISGLILGGLESRSGHSPWS